MTMQTNSLPVQLNAPSPTPNPRASTPGTLDGVNFGAALTRQIEQRQTEQRQMEGRQALVQPQPQPRPQPQPNMPQQAVAGPKPQPAPKPPANEAKAASREIVRQAAKETEHPPATREAEARQAAGGADKTVATTGEKSEETTSADAKVADAVVDMLALLASFNQAQQAVAVPAQAAAQEDALPGSAQGKVTDGTELLVKLDADAVRGAATDALQDKAAPGIDLRALETGKAGDAGKLPLDSADFAAALRDSAAQAASMKETAPGTEALTSLNAQATALQNAQAAGSAPPDRLSARVGTPAWDNQVGQKVIWMVGGADQSATLELNPPDLGPVQVVLNVSNDMASVTFTSQQLEVRQALENALPRLREMMNESGIALGNATVNAGTEGRQGQDGQGSGRSGRGKGGNGGDSDVAEVTPRQRTSILGGAGAVDTFA
ncbi:flagellar hook-length control protein FliK [Massilia sp. CMS3.1]|uniref:flagellar hook-length control protein FliK n=1 Tax=Massilia sp. CMS3.1 TaxID=3373083 RepID=UPI003EE4D879